MFAADAKRRSHKPRNLDAGMRALIVEKIDEVPTTLPLFFITLYAESIYVQIVSHHTRV